MTAEEIDILVQANIEGAVKEFQKLVPAIKQATKQVSEQINKTNFNGMAGKVQQAIRLVKQKLQSFKNSNKSNDIQMKVATEDAQKQVSQLQKQIDSLQEKVNSRQIQLNITNGALDKMRNDTRQSVIQEMPDAGARRIGQQTELRLYSDNNYTNLVNQSDKLNNEIIKYNALLDSAKTKMSQLSGETEQTGTSQSKLASFFSIFKSKLDQAKESSKNLKSSFSQLPKVTQNITNNIKNMGSGLKTGLGSILKYAASLFSLRGIYSILSSAAQAWLSSQNAGAQQLSANIDYMKYAMGSALAPVIQFVTNLVYQLMKAIQSVVYALFRVNIFANASASAMKSAAGNTKKAKKEAKQLAGVHDEINNVQIQDNSNNNTGSGSVAPSFDLSGVENIQSNILDAIKNGDWYKVGALLGEKLNNALKRIPWDKIQNTTKNIATNIAQFLNGFIETADWNLVGNTFAQGLNTIIYFGYSFITTFNWKQFGKAIGDSVNGFFKNVDWATAGKTLGEGIKGVFNTISGFFQTFDWSNIIDGLIDFLTNVDWSGVINSMFEALGSACASFVNLGIVIGTYISQAFDGIGQYFQDKVDECGGNIVAGIFKGIIDALRNIGQWIIDNIFKPFINGFKNAFGIHSPSSVMAEMGGYIIEGLKNGLSNIWEMIKSIFTNLVSNIARKFNEIKNNVTAWAGNVKSTVTTWAGNIKGNISECWNNVSNTVKTKINTLKSNISIGLSNAKTTITTWASNVKTSWINHWNTMANNVKTGLDKAKTTIKTWGDNAKTIFSNLGKNAITWGKDLVTNMSNGIKNNIDKVKGAVSSVADKIKGLLGFSEPEEGPLSNFHTYMPDMIDLMADGIKNNMSKVTDELENLASTMSYTINTPNIEPLTVDTNAIDITSSIQPQNIMEETFDRIMSRYQNDNSDRTINLTVNVGNEKLGQILLNDLRNRRRVTGKNLETLVGG